jgi:hypothetical protein
LFVVTVLLIDLIVAWKWGDWRNWQKYQSTILYIILCDLAYNFLTYNYPLWEYTPTLLFPNHTITSLATMFIAYTGVTLIYLGHYPKTKMKKLLWLSFWVTAWTVLEWVAIKLEEFKYFNGWSIWYSLLFNISLFIMLRLHYKRPLLTYVLSFIAAIALIILFNVPISKMK